MFQFPVEGGPFSTDALRQVAEGIGTDKKLDASAVCRADPSQLVNPRAPQCPRLDHSHEAPSPRLLDARLGRERPKHEVIEPLGLISHLQQSRSIANRPLDMFVIDGANAPHDSGGSDGS